VPGAGFGGGGMASPAADELIAATDLADLLVKRGTPFREAHGVIAGLVREAVDSGRPLAEVAVPALGDEAAEVLERSSWLESKVSEGGTSLARVREQLAKARGVL
jgi:argininosuccinate lyase